MKCRLCDRPTAAGTGKLCSDCARALQRARGAALSKLGPATATAEEAAAAPPITLTVARPEAAARRQPRPVLWAGIGLAAIAAVYVAQSELSPPRTVAPGVKGAPASLTERVNVEPAPVVTRIEEPSWTTPDASKTDPVADAPQAPASVTPVKAPVATAGARTTKPAKSPNQDSKALPLPAPAEYDTAPPKAPEADAQQLAANKIVAPTQPVDSGQVLASAMQKCGNEGGFSKFICEQKTYYAYCEDKWDKDPKCMRRIGER